MSPPPSLDEGETIQLELVNKIAFTIHDYVKGGKGGFHPRGDIVLPHSVIISLPTSEIYLIIGDCMNLSPIGDIFDLPLFGMTCGDGTLVDHIRGFIVTSPGGAILYIYFPLDEQGFGITNLRYHRNGLIAPHLI